MYFCTLKYITHYGCIIKVCAELISDDHVSKKGEAKSVHNWSIKGDNSHFVTTNVMLELMIRVIQQVAIRVIVL